MWIPDRTSSALPLPPEGGRECQVAVTVSPTAMVLEHLLHNRGYAKCLIHIHAIACHCDPVRLVLWFCVLYRN